MNVSYYWDTGKEEGGKGHWEVIEEGLAGLTN